MAKSDPVANSPNAIIQGFPFMTGHALYTTKNGHRQFK